MKDYSLARELNQKIVDGIFEGYRDYLEVRREKAKKLKVSGAYAWVKGNHIDHQVAVACESFGVESKLAKAGLTWQYLQFKNDDEEILFIVKNARYFNPDQVDLGKDATGRTRNKKMSYMEELMQINSEIDFNEVPLEHGFTNQLQLELLEDVYLNEDDNKEIAKIKSKYKRFYIVTYKIDENQQIEKISLWLPNPANNKAYPVEDLTKYINATHAISIDEELKNVLVNDNSSEVNLDAHVFGIALDDDDAKKKEN
ncbi:hypothetical protein B4065_0144 [Caldibacillus thermoamylovorans]|uniref:spr1630 family ClpXP-sensitive toxin n=1 Tax=Caldibacillus thermoamylovorans TaxID=35841 RepID=UPI0005A446D6|nr:hypothetical protein [Caldibacillus thermoamylovorans]KIO60218.1 hypothetical protein B4065_0144 [Caldibacillus thermoamylovorans]